jgi:CRP-like cAMP-binding protein
MMIFFDLFTRDPDLVELPARTILFNEGDVGEHMYVLVSGTADITVKGKLVEQAGHGTIIGELAVLEPCRRSATVMATADCLLARIDRKRFHYLVSQTPYFATEVMRVMAARLRHCDELL